METSTSGGSSNNNNNNSSGVIVTKERKVMRRIENPFTLKVGQVFTGFGIGCGVGIGVGRPLNLGAIPVLNEVMRAGRGATDAFSGVGRHVNNSLRKLGAKNIEAGIGCGVGFGHGFGVGLAVKPGVVHQIQLGLMQAITHAMTKLGIAPSLSVGQAFLPAPLQGGIINEPSYQNQMGSIRQLLPNLAENTSQSTSKDGNTRNSPETLASRSSPAKYSSQTKKVISNFLENPLLKDEAGELNELAERLRSENNLLQMVLKHQQTIEELMQENEKLRQILVEDLNISPSKLQTGYSSRKDASSVVMRLHEPSNRCCRVRKRFSEWITNRCQSSGERKGSKVA